MKMKAKLFKILLTLLIISLCVDAKKSLSGLGRSGSSSARGSSRRTSSNPRPPPTSHSYPQPSAPKPSLFGWQEKSKPSQTGSHTYPSNPTGLSGNNPARKPTTNQESIQRSSSSQNLAGSGGQTKNQNGHSYPTSNGLSGSGNQQSGTSRQQGGSYPQQSVSGISHQGSGYPQQAGTGISHQQGSGYPQGHGLSGSGVQPPPYSGAVAPPPYSGGAYQNTNYGNNYQHPQPPPPYSSHGSNYGGYGGHSPYHPNGPQMHGYGAQSPGYFGNYAGFGNKGGMSRSGSALTGVGIAGAGVGTLLTGLALWNLARSTGNRHHTVIYDNRGQPVAVAPDNNTESETNSMLADLVNCSLSISNDDKTEVLAIPCAIATSFSPNADVKESDINKNPTDNTKCTVTVLHKTGKEFMTTIPCSILLNTAAENNVTEPPLDVNDKGNNSTLQTTDDPNHPSALSLTSSSSSDVGQNNTSVNLDCAPPQPGEILDPINPCYTVTHNLTVIPLETREKNKADDS